MIKSIELDCAPGKPRPNALIMDVVKDTCLESLTDAENPASKFFGNWTWTYPDIPDETWNELQGILKFRITALYKAKIIRYGSW